MSILFLITHQAIKSGFRIVKHHCRTQVNLPVLFHTGQTGGESSFGNIDANSLFAKVHDQGIRLAGNRIDDFSFVYPFICYPDSPDGGQKYCPDS